MNTAQDIHDVPLTKLKTSDICIVCHNMSLFAQESFTCIRESPKFFNNMDLFSPIVFSWIGLKCQGTCYVLMFFFLYGHLLNAFKSTSP